MRIKLLEESWINDLSNKIAKESVNKYPKDYYTDIRQLAGVIDSVYSYKGYNKNYEYIELSTDNLGSEKSFYTDPTSKLSYIFNDKLLVRIDFDNVTHKNLFFRITIPSDNKVYFAQSVNELVDILSRIR